MEEAMSQDKTVEERIKEAKEQGKAEAHKEHIETITQFLEQNKGNFSQAQLDLIQDAFGL